MMRHWFYK